MKAGRSVGKFFKMQQLQIWARYGRWAYLIAGVCLGAILFSGAAVAQAVTSVVEQGKGGRYGAWLFEGKVADGASAAAVKPVTVAGVDPATGFAQNLVTDSSGRQVVIGAVADGAAAAGNPVLIAGSDSTNTQTLLTDTSGRPIIVGAAASGAPVAGNPVLICGSDGTNCVALQVDATGALVTAGASTSSDYVPAAPTNASCSANVSCPITGLTTEKTYQFSCSADFSYRAGTGTPVAVATDHDAKAGVMYRQMLGSSATAFAFISGSAMTCKAGLVPDAP